MLVWGVADYAVHIVSFLFSLRFLLYYLACMVCHIVCVPSPICHLDVPLRLLLLIVCTCSVVRSHWGQCVVLFGGGFICCIFVVLVAFILIEKSKKIKFFFEKP